MELKIINHKRHGSVILEFFLMLPPLLLLFGITLLLYDTFLGKLQLQQSNRLLAWVAADRYAEGDGFGDKLVKEAKAPFEYRNAWERALAGDAGDFWSFGSHSDYWAVNVERKQAGGKTYIGATPWAMLAAGNMELKMEHVSAAYVGIAGVSSAVQDNGEDINTSFLTDSWTLTHTAPPSGDDAESAAEGEDFSPEALVLRRAGAEHISRYENYRSKLWEIVGQDWPRLADSEPEETESSDTDFDIYKRALYNYAW